MTTKLEVLVIIPFAFHRESGSSLSSYYRTLALSEVASNINVITTPHGKDIETSNIKIIRTPKQSFFKSYQPGSYIKRMFYEPFLLLKTIFHLKMNTVNVVFIHGSSIYWAFLLQKFYNIPFIPMVHGNIQVELEKWGITKKSCIKKFAAKIEGMIINSFPHIIAEHETVKNILIQTGIKNDKISLIRICVKSLEPIEYPENNSEFNILYTGTFVEIQNLELIYKTATLLKDQDIKLKFILVGGIEEELKREQKKINKYSVEHLVKVYPRVAQKDLIGFYKMANIVISPREYGHDTPMKIFDYLNYGKCILATNEPIHTGILNNQVSYLASPNPKSFTDAIVYLIENQDKLQSIAKKGKTFFEEEFEFNNMVSKYSQVLKLNS